MDMTLAVHESAHAEEINLSSRTVNTLRFLAIDAVQKANSGHPGMPMGAASMAYVTWRHHMSHDPGEPMWPNRDRFILSAGHGSMLLYGLLHLSGYAISLDDIRNFRQWGSKTPGHPEVSRKEGIETTTGPLGQGFANGVGMAIAERYLAAKFNRPGFEIVDHNTYAIVSDGDLMEGLCHEAASMAGHLALGKLIYLYDDNGITIDGSTDLTYSEDVRQRFESYGWHVLRVGDGNDLTAIDEALQEAKSDVGRPTLIMVRTSIGYGSPNKQDTSAAHGAPLGDDEIRLTKRALAWPEDETFLVPEDVAQHMSEIGDQGGPARLAWEALLTEYEETHPELAEAWNIWHSDQLPEGWHTELPQFEAGSAIATRSASGKILQSVIETVPNLLGGSADLAGSNNTYLAGRGDFSGDHPGGGNIHFGIREHGMASLCNGIALHGGIRPYCATFLVFSDYMRPAIRLSGLMGLPVIYVLTHDSIGLGEDGPTHQPIEHIMVLRAIPNLTVIRPADGNETVEAWKIALQRRNGPVLFALTRQKMTNIDRSQYAAADGLAKGAYVLKDAPEKPEAILIATGSEVQLALEASEALANEGMHVRVVSMPSWELFEEQSEQYREEVLPSEIEARVAIEAGITAGWEKYVGSKGRIIGMTGYGASAPASELFEQFGFTVEHVMSDVKHVIGRN